MKHLPILLFLLVLVIDSYGQNNIGLRFGVLMNKINDCYSDDKDYRNQPAALGGYGFFFWRIGSDWGIQSEVGYSQRNTHVSRSGVSHHFSYDFRLKQLEMNLLGKFFIDIFRPHITVGLGLTTGYALTGREYIEGAAVGNFSILEYREVNFDNFDLRRFQLGPVFGLEIAQSLFGVGEIVLDSRYAYYPENNLHFCKKSNETRLSLTLGYKWNLKKN